MDTEQRHRGAGSIVGHSDHTLAEAIASPRVLHAKYTGAQLQWYMRLWRSLALSYKAINKPDACKASRAHQLGLGLTFNKDRSWKASGELALYAEFEFFIPVSSGVERCGSFASAGSDQPQLLEHTLKHRT
jgi:hypothetical protein